LVGVGETLDVVRLIGWFAGKAGCCVAGFAVWDGVAGFAGLVVG